MDPGTAVEIGYMFAQGKPLCGYTVDARDYPAKVEAYFRTAWQAGLRERPPLALGGASGSQEDPDGILVHSEGFTQNAMTEGFIRLSGGRVFAHADVDEAFRQAATHLASLLT
jgi:nucleoside 2-deoxyribosyltransferase